MRSNTIFSFAVILCLLVASGCEPRLNVLTPDSGPPHTLVNTNGNTIFSRILWNADSSLPDTLAGYWLGGGPFSVPPTAPLGDHDVALVSGSSRSASRTFTVTEAPVTYPDPTISHITTVLGGPVPGEPDRLRFMLFVQGPNIDVGGKIRIDGVDHDSGLWKALRYNSDGHDVTTLGYPIYHYAMLFAYPIEALIGSTLTIQVKNLDDVLSNSLSFLVPSESDWDSDGDGLLDRWEEEGYDGNADGVVDCDLPALGANKYIFDLFVEVDYMNGATPADDDIRPVDGSWPIIESCFTHSPLLNFHGGLQGVQIHVDRGQDTYEDLKGDVFDIPPSEQQGGQLLPFFDYVRYDDEAPDFAEPGETWENFYDHKDLNFNSDARREIFHYGIFANKHGHSDNASGRGEIFGNDFFVTLNSSSLASTTRSAGTFLHEFGHNMNLRHGGNDNDSRKPSHVSIMSYFSLDGSSSSSYQFGGVDTDCNGSADGVFEFSHGMHRTLNESSLNENVGLCDNTPVDWNGDGSLSSSMNFNVDGGTATLLDDHNNWGSGFRFDFRSSDDYDD